MTASAMEQLKQAVRDDDLIIVRLLLAGRNGVADQLNPADDSQYMPILAAARSTDTASLLIAHGARVDAVSRWWQSGYGVRAVHPNVGRFLVDQGAALSPHAAAAMGFVDELTTMIEQDPAVVTSKGGDGAIPLHFARDVPTAAMLIDRGSPLDARDDDHQSTPAQWLVREAPEVTRLLYERGATHDIFVAAALGDEARVKAMIADDLAVVAMRVGKAPFHPIGFESRGGTILQWSLGFNSYAHQYAAARGHQSIFQLLWGASDNTTKLLVACVMAMRDEALAIAAAHPNIVATLPIEDLRLVAIYCWETNVNIEAVRLMLDLGFPIDIQEHQHGFSALHNAAWGGYADLVDLLIARGAAGDVIDPNFNATPLNYAIHCATVAKRHPAGEYGRVVASLINAGSPWDSKLYPTGHAEIDAVLQQAIGES